MYREILRHFLFSGSGGGPVIPANALYEDDGVTILYEDDGTTILTES